MHLQEISRYDFVLHLAVKTDQYFEPCQKVYCAINYSRKWLVVIGNPWGSKIKEVHNFLFKLEHVFIAGV